MNDVIWCILTHEEASCVGKMLDHWQSLVSGEVVILYGGSRAEYENISHRYKGFIEDERLVTRDHPRERQSFCEVFRVAASLVEGMEAKYLYFTEYDQVPLDHSFEAVLLEKMECSGADLLCNGLARLDGTNHPHYLNHLNDGRLMQFMQHISAHESSPVVFSCWGFGQCWKKNAFMQLAEVNDEVRVYLELWIPTIAHHLGMRVGKLDIDTDWNLPDVEMSLEAVNAAREKPLVVHPLKGYWK